jgi:hypothetical protein
MTRWHDTQRFEGARDKLIARRLLSGGEGRCRAKRA